jgi:(2Fe-2S) ferredoxin
MDCAIGNLDRVWYDRVEPSLLGSIFFCTASDRAVFRLVSVCLLT